MAESKPIKPTAKEISEAYEDVFEFHNLIRELLDIFTGRLDDYLKKRRK